MMQLLPAFFFSDFSLLLYYYYYYYYYCTPVVYHELVVCICSQRSLCGSVLALTAVQADYATFSLLYKYTSACRSSVAMRGVLNCSVQASVEKKESIRTPTKGRGRATPHPILHPSTTFCHTAKNDSASLRNTVYWSAPHKCRRSGKLSNKHR